MSDIMNALFGPLNKNYCVLFYFFSIFFFIVFVMSLIAFVMMVFRGGSGPLRNAMLFHLCVATINAGLAYFIERLLHTMCVSSIR
jgi:ATP-dependent Zn protease